MGEFRRWRRFGHDRLYIHDHLGNQLGYWDLSNDSGHPAYGVALSDLLEPMARWRSQEALRGGTSAEAAISIPDAPTSVPETVNRPPQPPGPDFLPPTAPPGPSLQFPPPPEPAPYSPPPTAPAAQYPPPSQPKPQYPPPGPAPQVAVPRDAQAGAPQDLIWNVAGQNLQGEIDAAHAAGQRPTLVRRFFLGKAAYSSWERGAIGEREVARELDRLVRKDPRWGFIHSVPVGTNGSDIDHLLIGPGGVFTLNAKNHSGTTVWVGGNTLMVNGHRQFHIRNSRHEAQRAARLLQRASGMEVPVRGLVVAICRRLTVREQPDDVRVVTREALVRFLRHQPESLRQDIINELFHHARLPGTWAGR